MTTEIGAIAAAALGETPLSVEFVPTIEDSTVYRIETPSGRFFFKTEHEGHHIAMTAWAYARAAEAGVPVPDVVALDLTKERWPEEFVIVSAVAGTDLQHDPLEGDELARVLAESGEVMRQLHGVTVDGFGELEQLDDDTVAGEEDDHLSYLRERIAWGLPYLLQHDLVTSDTHDAVLEIVEAAERLAPTPARGSLLHGDVGLDHIFVDRSTMKITGLIDFEPEVADPTVDLGSFDYFYPDLIAYVLEGYGDLPDDIDVRLAFYGLVQTVGSTRWDHEKGLTQYVPRGLEEIERRADLLRALL
jgi:aminoglycoside phosphotransferase (APT) family kinase protein